MHKHTGLLFPIVFTCFMHASDPHITQPDNEPAQQEQHIVLTEEQFILVHAALQEAQATEAALKLTQKQYAELIELNKQLEANADSIFKERCAQLSQEVEQQKTAIQKLETDKRTVFWIMAPAVPIAGLMGTIVPKTVRTIVHGAKDNKGPVRQHMIPDVLKHLIQSNDYNKVIAGAQLGGVKISFESYQLLIALYLYANAKQDNVIAAFNSASIQNPDYTKHAKDLGAQLAITLLTQGAIIVTDDAVLIPGPKQTIILHKSQLIEAGNETAAQLITKYMQKNEQLNMHRIGSAFVANTGTQIGYNLIVQAVHAAAKKTGYQHDALTVLLPKDCKPKDELSYYTKLFIRCGISIILPYIAQWAFNQTVGACMSMPI